MILITGASRGIGNFLFKKFLASGKTVFGTYLNTEPTDSNDEYFTKVDIGKPVDVQNWIFSIKGSLKRVVLINCAGSNYNAMAHKADLVRWSKIISTNLVGTFSVIQAVLPFMREEGFGRIINFSSIVAQEGIPGTSAYAASKSGLWGLSKSISAEVASKGITINNLNLGYFNIGMINEVPLNIQDQIKQKIPCRKFGDPEDIYQTVRLLIRSNYINGTSIDINGGLH